MDMSFTPRIHMYTKDIAEELVTADCKSGGKGAPMYGNLPLHAIDTTCYVIKRSGSGAAFEVIRAPSYTFPNMASIIKPHLQLLPKEQRVGLLQSIEEYDKQAKECVVEIERQFMIVVDKHHMICQRVIDAIQNGRMTQKPPGSQHEAASTQSRRATSSSMRSTIEQQLQQVEHEQHGEQRQNEEEENEQQDEEEHEKQQRHDEHVQEVVQEQREDVPEGEHEQNVQDNEQGLVSVEDPTQQLSGQRQKDDATGSDHCQQLVGIEQTIDKRQFGITNIELIVNI
uniref:Uncharacterized protein n=1 Tax=Oryza brachyantha TaxID=4533 RepID=J3N0K0_ORYBR